MKKKECCTTTAATADMRKTECCCTTTATADMRKTECCCTTTATTVDMRKIECCTERRTPDCGKHGYYISKKRLYQLACACSLVITLSISLSVVLRVRGILRPTKPRFILEDATVFAFNVSTPNFLTSNIQVTLNSRNRNNNIGIHYDKLDVYATYRNQQITQRTRIPPTYQGHKSEDIWSPFVFGNSVPIAPYNGLTLCQEQAAGTVRLMIKIDGRVSWKVGIITGRYNLYVRCPASITFGNANTGVIAGDNVVKYQISTRCAVSV